MLNSYLIYKMNSTFGEFILNFVKYDTHSNILIGEKPNMKIHFYLIVRFLLPILYDLMKLIIKKLNLSKLLATIQKITKTFCFLSLISELIYKFIYIFDTNFTYFTFIDHIFKMMTINKGTTGNVSDKFLNIGKQLNLFLLFIFLRLGEWYYSKDSSDNKTYEIEAPLDIRDKDLNSENVQNKKIINRKCFICEKFPKLENVMLSICCGLIFCEECYLKENNQSNKSQNHRKNVICPLCEKHIDDSCCTKIYI